MNIFEKIYKLINIEEPNESKKYEESLSQNISSPETYSDDYKELFARRINDFLTDYKKNLLIEEQSPTYVDSRMTEMKNFIEKMAIIYEIIYPDISFLQAEDKFINDSYVNQVMFKDNKYLNDTLEEETLLEELEWNKFIGVKPMIKILSEQEKELLRKPSYNMLINLKSSGFWDPWDSLTLTKRGVIRKTRLNKRKSALKDEDLIGCRASKVVERLKNKNIPETAYIELANEVTRVDRLNKQRDAMLECIMFRIMERGYDFLGARRALLFANDFSLVLEKPLIYEINGTTEDFNVAAFLRKYSDLGGNLDYAKNLMFSEDSKYTWCYDSKMELEEDLKSEEEKAKEQELRQRLVTSLYGNINQEELAQEKVKHLRLERRLNRKKND